MRKKDKRILRARKLRRDMTDAEQKLWKYLRRPSFQAAHFRRQATIGPYFVDFACHTNRLAIELDGGHHESGNQAEYDEKRDAFLRSNGYHVLRFWNNEVLQNIDGVLTVIHETLNAAIPPTPDPSPPLASLVGGGEYARSNKT